MAKKEKKKNILQMDIKDINFGSRKVKVPTKTTMNLYVDPNPTNPFAIVAVAVILVAAAALLYWFGVAGRMTKLDQLRSTYNSLSSQYEQINANMYGYDEVSEKYYRYTKFYLTDNEASLPEMTEVMDIIDKTAGKVATIYDMNISGNNVSLTVSVSKIGDFASIREMLSTYSNVDNIKVYYANKDYDDVTEASVVSGSVSFDVWKESK